MQNRKIAIATIIGIILFITDLKYGWIAYPLSGIPSIFLIVFIVGIIAGDGGSGFVSGILAEVLGVLIVALLPEILSPEFTISGADVFSRMWAIMILSVSYSVRFESEPIIVIFLWLILLVWIAPLIFGMAILFGPLGGFIGSFIYSRVSRSEATPARVPSPQPQLATPPPLKEEPIKDTSFPDVETSPEDVSDEEPDSPE